MNGANSNINQSGINRQKEPREACFSSTWITLIANRIRELATTKSSVIVSICGGSATGKSTQVAFQLMNEIKMDTRILSYDDFIAEPEILTKKYGWGHPGCYDLDGVQFVLKQISKRKFCSVPQFSFTRWKRTGYTEWEPCRITLFEGLYTALDGLHEYSDLVIYVEMSLYMRLVRRLVRNTHERYVGDPQLALENFMEGPVNAHMDFVRRQRTVSDVIVRVPFFFKDSITRFNLQPVAMTLPSCESVYKFTDDDSMSIAIMECEEGLFFSLEYESLTYFYFPVKYDTLKKLRKLDMMSL